MRALCGRLRLSDHVYFLAAVVLRRLCTVNEPLTTTQLGCCAVYVTTQFLGGPSTYTWQQWSDGSDQLFTRALEQYGHVVVAQAYQALCAPTLFDVLTGTHPSARSDFVACMHALETTGATWYLDPEAVTVVLMTFQTLGDARQKVGYLFNDVLFHMPYMSPQLPAVLRQLNQDML